MNQTQESGEVKCTKDDGDDILVEYERREDDLWYVISPDGDVGMVNPGADKRTVEQLIRKEHDDDY